MMPLPHSVAVAGHKPLVFTEGSRHVNYDATILWLGLHNLLDATHEFNSLSATSMTN